MLLLQATPSLPVQVVRGVYLGVLTGVIPALVAWSLGFLFRSVTGLSIPAFAVIGLGVAIAGVNGGLLALTDPAVRDGSAPDGATVEPVDATVVAVQPGDGPVEPVPSTGRALGSGDVVYVAGRLDALRRVEEAAGAVSSASSESAS